MPFATSRHRSLFTVLTTTRISVASQYSRICGLKYSMSSPSSSGSISDSESATSSSPLVGFFTYPNGSTDSRGRTLSQILSWGDDKLEYSHDYIQVVFPLPERSGVNWNAPLIDRATFVAFRTQPALRARLREAFERMMAFYGFGIAERRTKTAKSQGDDAGKERAVSLERLPEFERRARDSWLTRFDHNHLRITRILRCLRVLGLEAEAKAFHMALMDVVKERPGTVSGTSVMFWGRAMERPLNVKPDDDAVRENTGPLFLREFERGTLVELAEKSIGEETGADKKSTVSVVSNDEKDKETKEDAVLETTDGQK